MEPGLGFRGLGLPHHTHITRQIKRFHKPRETKLDLTRSLLATKDPNEPAMTENRILVKKLAYHNMESMYHVSCISSMVSWI